jgi:4-oxalmesaconate hydratase
MRSTAACEMLDIMRRKHHADHRLPHHYTRRGTAPGVSQSAASYADPATTVPPAKISDEQIRETIESNQLRLQKDRGADMTLFSPRASA